MIFYMKFNDKMPELVPGDGILTNLGTETEDLIQMLLHLKKKKKFLKK